jgi:hypothetical protein
MRVVQAETDMGEIDGNLPRASDSLGALAADESVLRKGD